MLFRSKPATLTPLSALNFVSILVEAGVPPGVVNLVTGGGDFPYPPKSSDVHHEIEMVVDDEQLPRRLAPVEVGEESHDITETRTDWSDYRLGVTRLIEFS